MIEQLLLIQIGERMMSTSGTLVIQIDAECEAAARLVATTNDRLGFRTNTYE